MTVGIRSRWIRRIGVQCDCPNGAKSACLGQVPKPTVQWRTDLEDAEAGSGSGSGPEDQPGNDDDAHPAPSSTGTRSRHTLSGLPPEIIQQVLG